MITTDDVEAMLVLLNAKQWVAFSTWVDSMTARQRLAVLDYKPVATRPAWGRWALFAGLSQPRGSAAQRDAVSYITYILNFKEGEA